MKKILILSITTALALTLIFVLLLLISPSRPPEPPYFTETRNKEYIISEENGIYYIPTVLNNKKAKIPIGKSKVELKEYVGKRVKLKIDFPTTTENFREYLSTKQCILDKCHPIDREGNTEYITVNILDIEEL